MAEHTKNYLRDNIFDFYKNILKNTFEKPLEHGEVDEYAASVEELRNALYPENISSPDSKDIVAVSSEQEPPSKKGGSTRKTTRKNKKRAYNK